MSLPNAKGKPSESKKTNSSGELSFAKLQEIWDSIPPQLELTESALIAPNKKIAKIMAKDYPGITIVLRKDYKGYDLPKDWRKVK